MNRTQLTVIAGLSVAGAAALYPLRVSAAPFLPVPPGSFINYHVSTSKGLSEEVARDVVVRARLARHFHMAQPDVYEYVRQNLITARLTPEQAGVYRVACIGAGGHEYFVTEHLRAGTPVFVLASTGEPVLKLACGNPLVSSLPMVESKLPVAPQGPPVIASNPTAMPQPTVVASALIPNDMALASAPLSGYEFTGVGPVVNVGGFTQALTSGGGNGGLFAGLLGGAALIGVAAGHGHSGASIPVTPAPEPENTIVLGLGTLGLAGLVLRARRRPTA